MYNKAIAFYHTTHWNSEYGKKVPMIDTNILYNEEINHILKHNRFTDYKNKIVKKQNMYIHDLDTIPLSVDQIMHIKQLLTHLYKPHQPLQDFNLSDYPEILI